MGAAGRGIPARCRQRADAASSADTERAPATENTTPAPMVALDGERMTRSGTKASTLEVLAHRCVCSARRSATHRGHSVAMGHVYHAAAPSRPVRALW